jgi:hypothetical protein
MFSRSTSLSVVDFPNIDIASRFSYFSDHIEMDTLKTKGNVPSKNIKECSKEE